MVIFDPPFRREGPGAATAQAEALTAPLQVGDLVEAKAGYFTGRAFGGRGLTPHQISTLKAGGGGAWYPLGFSCNRATAPAA